MKLVVYVALNSVPDYTAPAPSFKSVHRTLEGAKKAFGEQWINHWSPSGYVPNTWNGPDGFGMIRKVEVQP